MLRPQEVAGVGDRTSDAQNNADVCFAGSQGAATEECCAHQREDHSRNVLFVAAKTEEQDAKAHSKQREGILQRNTDAGGDIPIGFVQENQRSHIEQGADRKFPGKSPGVWNLFELGCGKGQQNDGRYHKFDKQSRCPGDGILGQNLLYDHGNDTADHTHGDGVEITHIDAFQFHGSDLSFVATFRQQLYAICNEKAIARSAFRYSYIHRQRWRLSLEFYQFRCEFCIFYSIFAGIMIQ